MIFPEEDWKIILQMKQYQNTAAADEGSIFLYALKKSMPVFCGYIFLGSAFGIMMAQSGYDFIWAFFISLLVYAGSLQFAMVSFLAAGTSLPTVAPMTLFINSRHMFYGLPFIEKFKRMGKLYPYMIFSLTDETYSILYSCSDSKKAQQHDNRALFYISALHQFYWIAGSVLGTLAGQYMTMIDFTGIDFSMTALFIVILVEQLLSNRQEALKPAITGGVVSAVCLIALGAQAFLLPSLIIMALIIMMTERRRKMQEDTAHD